MKTKIGISEKDSTALADILNTLLADEYVLYTKTRNYHWNVTGPYFAELHAFFQTQYEALAITIDEIAERVRIFNRPAAGSLAAFLKMTHLAENKDPDISSDDMLRDLLNDYEIIIRWLRDKIPAVDEKMKDAGTADFLTGLMEQHEKTAWMIRAHLR